MPLSITVTKRQLRNRETGIDMSVPSYGRASSPKLVKDYHVVVITKLPFFKLAEHSEEDIVQFMVPRDYAAFESLQKDLIDTFPELKLPDLPRKYHLFLNQSDIDERQIAFDCLLKVIAKSKEMCTSVPLLRFLGFGLLADRNYYKRRREYLQKEEEAQKRKKKGGLFEEGEEKEGPGDPNWELFGETSRADRELFQEEPTRQTKKPYSVSSLFDDEEEGVVQGPRRSAKISLLEEDSGGDLFIPTEASGKGTGGSEEFETEDNSELLHVSETLDDVLQIVNEKTRSKKPAPKPLPTTKTSHSKAKSSGLFDTAEEVPEMGTDDIMKYIQQNQATNDDDLDLF